MDRDQLKALLDQVLAEAGTKFGEAHPTNLVRLGSFIATCKMIVDDMEDTVQYDGQP